MSANRFARFKGLGYQGKEGTNIIKKLKAQESRLSKTWLEFSFEELEECLSKESMKRVFCLLEHIPEYSNTPLSLQQEMKNIEYLDLLPERFQIFHQFGVMAIKLAKKSQKIEEGEGMSWLELGDKSSPNKYSKVPGIGENTGFLLHLAFLKSKTLSTFALDREFEELTSRMEHIKKLIHQEGDGFSVEINTVLAIEKLLKDRELSYQ